VVEIKEFVISDAIFVSFRNEVDIVAHYDHTPFWISAHTNRDFSLHTEVTSSNSGRILQGCYQGLKPQGQGQDQGLRLCP